MAHRIDHATQSIRLAAGCDEIIEAEGATDATLIASMIDAHRRAVLALVEQQRLANLIALLKDTFASHEALEVLSDVATAQSGQLISLRPDIAAALGIEVRDA